jgi:cyclopropane fatty-acyl-phospholipid synthase-like methyltransferase
LRGVCRQPGPPSADALAKRFFPGEVMNSDDEQRVAYAALRPDLQAVADLTPVGTKVLDLGCGDGALLSYLVRHKKATGRGIELSEAGVMACVPNRNRIRKETNNTAVDMRAHPR